MLNANDQILKAFLVSVGFQIDDNAFRRFTNGMARVDSKAMLVGKTVAAVAVAAEAMVHVFSMQMEKLYYSSQRTKASVQNIQALEYGMQQIGINADTARSSLEAMAASVRMNPGLRGLLDQILGRSTAGEDQAKVMLDLVSKLGKMPHMVGARFAQMFGMDEQTFLMMVQKGPELARAMEQRIELTKRAGFEADAAAKASREYMNSWREIIERIEVTTQKLSIELLPTFRRFTSAINNGLDALTKFKFDPKTITDLRETRDTLFSIATSIMNIADKIGLVNFASMLPASIREDMLAAMHFADGMLSFVQGNWSDAKEAFVKGAHRLSGSPTPKPGAPREVSGKMSAERPAGTSAAIGAARPAGLSPAGISTGLAEAGSTERYEWNLAQLKEAIRNQRGAMQQKILNEELTRLQSPASASLLAQVAQTKGYAPTSAGAAAALGIDKNKPSGAVELTMNTDIHVNGAGDSASVARNVAGAQRQVGSEICRNLQGCVR